MTRAQQARRCLKAYTAAHLPGRALGQTAGQTEMKQPPGTAEATHALGLLRAEYARLAAAARASVAAARAGWPTRWYT